MEWEMWRRGLLVLMVVGKGTLTADGNNGLVFEELCSIARNVTTLMEKQKDSGAKTSLWQALYGEDRMVRFDKDGSLLTVHGCGFGSVGRSEYCSQKQGGSPSVGFDKPGCFTDSLMGTFLCLCVPGNHNERNLCGLNNVGNGAMWTSWNGETTKNLLYRVWEEVKKKCMGNNAAIASEHLGDLDSAVKNITGSLKKVNNGGYFTLGGTDTNGICGGTNPGHACVTYVAKGDGPHIPWANKILSAIATIRKTLQQKLIPQNPSTTSSTENYEDPSDNAPGNDDEVEEEDEEQYVQNATPQNHSKPSRTKRKRRDTNKQRTEQHPEPRKATHHHDDGSFLPQPFWLLSAVFIF